MNRITFIACEPERYIKDFPRYIQSEFSNEFKKSVQNVCFTPKSFHLAFLDFYKSVYVKDEAKILYDNWVVGFTKRLKDSVDAVLCLGNEKKMIYQRAHLSASKKNILVDDIDGVYYPISSIGFKKAVNGDNQTVFNEFRSWLFSASNFYEDEITFKNIEIALCSVRELISGYADAMIYYQIIKRENELLKYNSNMPNKHSVNKLKWLGNTAQFGFIIQELIGKGYIERPSSSYAKDVEILLQHFDVDAKASSIEKEISTGEGQNSLSTGNRTKFRIPPKDSMK